MEIKGKIILALPEVSGTSKSGNPWKKREYVLETQETYPRKVFFNFFGDKADQYALNVGEVVTVSFDIESREFNGRWYTDIRGWKAEKEGQQQQQTTPVYNQGGVPTPPASVDPFSAAPGAAEDDIPF
ncbi:MAG: DUF3127 domain-containing protein [Bacteroides sp.]|nr:DUF3127 domain-containing protein [Bacteroides sp.]MCM1413412.1 DUF3127 domain-containing protein [Bacteroides sp.]MCM1471377.1 DUF3127 domain-containing protein [Bacteroides sp.]